MDSGAVVVFARAPVAGATKRRLIPALGAAGAARLHQQMTEHMVTQLSNDGLTLELWCAPSAEHPFFADLQRRFGLSLHDQVGEDLGARMEYALADALRRHQRVVLIGTDCPFLSCADLHRALGMLSAERDMVLGVAQDGGYVMIGLRARCPALFEGVEWGTARVAPQTYERARQAGLRCHDFGPFQDIDRPEDLAHLRASFGAWLAQE